MTLRSRLLLASAFLPLLFTGCRTGDSPSTLNRDLIRLLDAQDRLATAADGKPDGKRLSAKYVIHGGRGQLFYLEDLRAALVKAGAFDASLALIAQVSAGLKAKGIRLLVVPVPTKVEIHPELLGGRNVPDLSDAKDRFLHKLDSLGVDHLDLRKAFFRAKDSVRLFPRTDTHWDQPAIRLAANLLMTGITTGITTGLTSGLTSRSAAHSAPRSAAHIHPDGMPSGMDGLTDTTLLGFQGDLAEKFNMADSDTLRLQRVGNGRGGFFGEPDSAEILLYGDSFLRQYSRYSAHLGAHLSRELGSPVKTVYSLKGFIEGPERIRDLVDAYPRARTVVWVFTSRSLMEVTF